MKRIVAISLLVFVALASNQHAKAEPQENKSKFDVTILEPGRDNVVVEREMDVKGRARIPSGNHLWVLVHSIKGFEKVWWPQNEVEIDPQTGQWTTRVFLGLPRPRDTGYDFAIAAITVNEQEHLKLQQYRKDAIAKSDWQPVKMPPTTAPPIYRKVKRDGNVVNGKAVRWSARKG